MKKCTTTKLRTGIALTVAGVTFTPEGVQALGIRVMDQDPFAIARGNAFVATADNPSAIYYNPAGITQLGGHHFSLGANLLSVSSEVNLAGGGTYETADEWHVLPEFYYTFSPESLPLSFGIGAYSPFGLGVEWPDQTPFRMLAIDGEMRYGTLNPVVSWAITDNLSVGGGPMFNYADTSLSKGLSPSSGLVDFNGDGWSVGFNAGVLWQITEKHSVGATYRSASKIDFEGSAFIEYPANVLPSRTVETSAEFQFPQIITIGYSFRPTEKWNFEVNVDWTDWDSLDSVSLELPVPPGPQTLEFNWQSSWIVNVGGTRYFGDGWQVSAGYIYSQNSVPEEWFNPGIPDSDRHVFSVGAGKQWERFGVDAAFQYGYGPSRTVDNPALAPNASANGDYEFHSLSFVLAGRMSF